MKARKKPTTRAPRSSQTTAAGSDGILQSSNLDAGQGIPRSNGHRGRSSSSLAGKRNCRTCGK